MNHDIVYGYVRRVSLKLMIAMAIILAILIYIGLTTTTKLGNTDSEVTNVLLAYYGALAVFGLFFLFGLVMYLAPNLHPVFRRVSSYGSPEEIAALIDKDAQDFCENVKLSKAGYYATFTPNWIVWSRGILGVQLRIVNLSDVAWVYPHTLVVNGQPQHSLKVHDITGKKTDIYLYRNQQMTGKVLDLIMRHAPWVITGYSAEKEAAWKRDRQSIIDAVSTRRQQVQAAKAQPAQAARVR